MFEDYDNTIPFQGGILFRVKNRHNCFMSIKFGDKDNSVILKQYFIDEKLQLFCFDELEIEVIEEDDDVNIYGSILHTIPYVLDETEIASIEDLEPLTRI